MFIQYVHLHNVQCKFYTYTILNMSKHQYKYLIYIHTDIYVCMRSKQVKKATVERA